MGTGVDRYYADAKESVAIWTMNNDDSDDNAAVELGIRWGEHETGRPYLYPRGVTVTGSPPDGELVGELDAAVTEMEAVTRVNGVWPTPR